MMVQITYAGPHIKEEAMFKHVAMWKFADVDDPGANRVNAINIKAALEELVYEVHGLLEVEVCIEPIDAHPDRSDSADIYMECLFENREAYDDFLKHPHLLAADKLIRFCTGERLAMTFEVIEEMELP